MFDQKNIVVVGSNSGIGTPIIEQLLSQNAKVTLIGRKAPALAHPNLNFITHNIGIDAIEQIILPETIHGLVYLPGTINLKPLQRLSIEDLIQDFQINTVGAFAMVKHALKGLKMASGASVVFFSTVAATTGMSFHIAVAAAKGALEAMARSMAAEMANVGIRVNTIAPSLTDTPLAQNLLSDENKQAAASKRHPIGRYAQPNDYTAITLWLLSKESGFMTGQTLHIDGGLSVLR